MRGRATACDVVDALVAQRTEIDPAQKMLPGPEQDGRDGQVQLVNEAGAEVLPDRGHAATQSDVAAACGVPGLLQRGVNPVGDEMKYRAALHREGRSRVMSQHEDRHVVRRLVTPPAFPAVIRPRAPYGTKHVSTENPGADSFETLRRNIVICPCFAVFIPMHPLPGARVEEPFKQCRTADSQRVL